MKKLQFSDHFVVRTPLFSLDELPDFDTWWEKGDLAFDDSLYLASPDLSARIQRLKCSKNASTEDVAELKKAALKYWTRAHTRCTPFGLFAGCSMGQWGPDDKLVLPGRDSIRRFTRLDMDFLCTLAKQLENQEDIRSQLVFWPNTSIYAKGEKIRYVYYTYDERNNRSHQLREVHVNEYVTRVLDLAKGGVRLHQLAEELTDEEVLFEEAYEFVGQFVDSQLLVSELEVAITGPDYMQQIQSVLIAFPEQTSYIKHCRELLKNIEEQLAKLDTHTFNTAERYQEVIASVDKLGTPYDWSKLFQTDMYKAPSQAITLPKKLQREILHAIDFLYHLIPPIQSRNLQRFIDKFEQRYEGRRVKLIEVLDTESGIGFPVDDVRPLNNPIVTGIDANNRPWEDEKLAFGKYERFLRALIERAQINGEAIIDLQPERHKHIMDNEINLSFPPSITLLGAIVRKNEAGDIQFKLDFAGGSSGINLLSRFAYISPDFHTWVKDTVEFEKERYQDVLLAEIVHLPNARTGNILKHPPFMDYEVCYLAKASQAATNLPLDDLEIFIRNGQIYLWSTQHNRQVIPRLSNAHNFVNSSLPVYSFLCSLQTHYTHQGLSFSWGHLSQMYNYFPRICFGNIILSEARWIVRKEMLDSLMEKHSSLERAFHILKQKLEIPDTFLLVEGDNELLIDTQNALSLGIFLDMINKRESTILSEFLFDADSAIARDQGGLAYANEFIGILHHPTFVAVKPTQITGHPKLIRSFPPGSEWLYVKIYCGEKSADQILSDAIGPLIQNLEPQAYLEKWFFIRYADPDTHLRVRFKLTERKFAGELQTALLDCLTPLLMAGIIHDIKLDTYHREIHRYGEASMELAESWFYEESRNLVQFLSAIEGEEGEELRWQYAMLSIDQMMMGFQFDQKQKAELMREISQAFSGEFRLDKALKRKLDKKFRSHKTLIYSLLNSELWDEAYEHSALYQIVGDKWAATREICVELLSMLCTEDAHPNLKSLLSSLIHMLCNRIFVSNQRLHETVVYYLLSKHYSVNLSRSKYDQSNT